jgi:hypothetical protein
MAEPAKKHITQLTSESRAFWTPLFKNLKLEEFQYSAKIGYLSKEFEENGLGRVPAVRFFRNELTKGDIYFEIFNFDNTLYYGTRRLYKLNHNPFFEADTVNYKKINHPTFETYAVKMTDFELINESPMTALFPEFHVKTVAEPTTVKSYGKSESGALVEEKPEAKIDNPAITSSFPILEEFEDANANQMTMRDYYCMLQNVPMSNKKWLNQLISEGRKWQK